MLTTLKVTQYVVDIPISASNSSSMGRASLKRVAKPSLVPVPNSQACFGQYAEPTPSSPCAAASSTAALKTTGKRGEHDFQLSCRAPAGYLYTDHIDTWQLHDV